MKKNIKKQLIEALKDQKDIFGDELFEELKKRRTTVVTEEVPSKKTDEPGLFQEEKEDWEKAQTIDELEGLINNCTKCPLHEGRNKFVFGSGNPNADIMCVGEGPGAEEDKQ